MHKKSLHEHVFSIFIGDSEHVLIGIDAYLYMLLAHSLLLLTCSKESSNENTRAMCYICSDLTIKTPERRQ